jgi:hypothetical protein
VLVASSASSLREAMADPLLVADGSWVVRPHVENKPAEPRPAGRRGLLSAPDRAPGCPRPYSQARPVGRLGRLGGSGRTHPGRVPT